VPDGRDPATVPAPHGDATVVGWLQPPEGTGEPDPDPGDDVVPQLRIADLVQRVDVDLYGAYLVLDPERTDGPDAAAATGPGLEPATLDQLPEAGQFTALRNLLYAVEWWVFAGFAAFVWWRYVRDVTAEAAAEEADGSDPAEQRLPSGS
jgi:cytochrome oxidase assembly protein ShyY1